jgi:excisionase family DNA binding protein
MATGALSGGVVSPPPRRSNALQQTNAPRPPLLDFEDVAEWLGVEAVFVRRLVSERRIPFVKIGKYVRFQPEVVSVWIDRQRVQPADRSSRMRVRNKG